MTLSTNIICKIQATENLTGDLDSTLVAFKDRDPVGMPSGIATGQADKQWSDTRTVGTGGETLDVTALTDSLGRTVNFVKLKVVHIRPSSLNTSNIIVGNAASAQVVLNYNTATWTVTLEAGGIYFRARPGSGWPTAGANLLKVVGGAAGQIYDIELIGTSA
jgi:hypothetical protein